MPVRHTPSLGWMGCSFGSLLSPLPDVGKGEGEEEEEEDGGPPCPPAAPKNCLPRRGISVLEKLIKTCPVWLQLGLGRAEAARILHQEVAGVSRGLCPWWPADRHGHQEPRALWTAACFLSFLRFIRFSNQVFFPELRSEGQGGGGRGGEGWFPFGRAGVPAGEHENVWLVGGCPGLWVPERQDGLFQNPARHRGLEGIRRELRNRFT